MISGKSCCLLVCAVFLGIPLLGGCVLVSVPPSPDEQVGSSVSSVYLSRADDARAEALYQFSLANLQAAEGDIDAALQSLERALVVDPSSTYLRLSLADLYLTKGEQDKAISLLEGALIHEPDSIDAHLFLAKTFMARQEFPKALDHFRELARLEPGNDTHRIHLAIAYARSRAFQRGIGVLKELLAEKPESTLAELTLARIYQEAGMQGLAEEVYSAIIDKRPDFEAASIELGRMYEGQDDGVGKALEIYRTLLQNNPGNVRLRHHVVSILINENKLEEALQELRELIAQNPTDLEAKRKTGLIYLQLEDWGAAATEFRSLFHLDPTNEKVRFYLGTALERQGEWGQALSFFESIPKDSDLAGDALYHQAYLLHQLTRTAEAVARLKANMDLLQQRPEVFDYLASLYEAIKQNNEAMNTLDQGIGLYPEDAGLWYHRGILRERMGSPEEARVDMEHVLILEPENFEAMNFLAYSFAEKAEQLERALELVSEALKLSDQAHIRDTLGWVYFKLKKYEKARSELEKATSLLPDDPVVMEHLADVYLAMELRQKAIATYKRALEIDPENKKLEQKLKEIIP